MSISGWFHAPIEGEEGHEEDKRLHGDEYSGGKSSLQQLVRTSHHSRATRATLAC